MFIDVGSRYRFVPAGKEKGGEFKVGKMAFHVHPKLARTITHSKKRRQVRTMGGGMVDLAEFKGEAVFRTEDIRIEQLGWLSLKRYVEYILLNEKEGLVAVCVQ